MGIGRQIGDWDTEVRWLFSQISNSRPIFMVLGFLFAAAVYHIWVERNYRRFKPIERESGDRLKEIVLQLHIVGQSNAKLEQLNRFPC